MGHNNEAGGNNLYAHQWSQLIHCHKSHSWLTCSLCPGYVNLSVISKDPNLDLCHSSWCLESSSLKSPRAYALPYFGVTTLKYHPPKRPSLITIASKRTPPYCLLSLPAILAYFLFFTRHITLLNFIFLLSVQHPSTTPPNRRISLFSTMYVWHLQKS